MTPPAGRRRLPSRLPLHGLGALALSLALVLAGCGGQDDVHEARYYVFGTLVDVTVAGADVQRSSRAFTELQRLFQSMHRDWHPWEPGLLTDVNRAFARGEPAPADADIVAMVEAAQDFEEMTGGRFNPAIGKLIEAWGFHTSEFPVRGAPPSAAEIEALVALAPSTRDIEIRNNTLTDRSRNVQLDFSGLAKGLAVDRACAVLEDLGIAGALVNAGGDVRGYGTRHGSAWRIGVRNPLGGVIGTIELQDDEAVFTSGNYERFRIDDVDVDGFADPGDGVDERYPHILDPRTGWPARSVMSATVIADDGMRADAAATALVVAGLKEWQDVAEPLGIDAVLLTDEAGNLYATTAMRQRLVLEKGLELLELGDG